MGAGVITQACPNLNLVVFVSHQMNFVGVQIEEVKLALE